VIDRAVGPDTPRGQPAVGRQQVLDGSEGERHVMQAPRRGRLLRPLGVTVARELGSKVDERHPMVLVVVGDEAELGVLERHVSAEHLAVPLLHLGLAVGLEHDVGQLGRAHRPPPGNDRLGARAFRDLAVPAGVPRVDQTQARYHHAA